MCLSIYFKTASSRFLLPKAQVLSGVVVLARLENAATAAAADDVVSALQHVERMRFAQVSTTCGGRGAHLPAAVVGGGQLRIPYS